MALSGETRRYLTIALVVGFLATAAGCSAIGSSSPDVETTADPTETQTPTPTETPTETQTTADDGGDARSSSDDGSAALSGEMVVVVAGEEIAVSADGSRESGFWFDEDAENYGVWHAGSENVTLAAALSTLGVDASADAVEYGGDTYEASADGTSLHYRVDGESVDPEEYTLENGDEVWVTVETEETDAAAPGPHIHHHDLHVHGSIDFVVDGEEVDFGADRYQSSDHGRYFHFEGGEAEPWHAHSWAVTLDHAMATLPGIDVREGAVTHGNVTYEANDPDTTVTVEVNGESVTPADYFLKDGDHVRIVVETDAEG